MFAVGNGLPDMVLFRSIIRNVTKGSREFEVARVGVVETNWLRKANQFYADAYLTKHQLLPETDNSLGLN